MTPEIVLVLVVLCVTIVLFVTEALRVDVVAMLVMVALPWLGLIEPEQAFVGFSSGAVVSIMAVVIMGHGLDRTGITRSLARPILRIGKGHPRRLRAALFTSVGVTSAFMQNVGAAALFLPVALRVARLASIKASRLLMPLGFSAILGGTLTMVGSSPLIVLNDIVASQGEERFGLFAVTPIGVALLGTGVLVFTFFGDRLLPRGTSEEPVDDEARRSEMLASWSLHDNLEEVMVPADSPLVGMTRKDARLIARFGAHVLAVREVGRTVYAPSAETKFAAGQRLALLGEPEAIERLVDECGLKPRRRVQRFAELRRSETAGFAEVLVPPRSTVVGQTLRQVGLRRNLGLEPLSLLSGGRRLAREFADVELRPGDIVLVQGPWSRVRALGSGRDFVLVRNLDRPEPERDKAPRAALCFLGALALTFAGASLPLALFSGALAMILTGVMKVDDAYRAVSWRTVFLLAGLIPLGVALKETHAAEYLAGQLFRVLEGAPDVAVLFTVAVAATAFTLFMSNVAATVVLVPLAMDLGRLTGIDPRAMALLVGVCAQNSFVLPTHQVNALLMPAGGYRNADYLKVGGVMTLLFLPIAVLGVDLLLL